MKEQYISPELNVLCFAPEQPVANTDVRLNLGGGPTDETSPGGDGDFGVDIF